VIHIYEADYNLSLGVKWRAAMHQAEDLQLLNEGQYGSRPNRNATEPVFLEEMQLEISRATRKPLVLVNYDATACYDRIIPNLGMTVSQKYGVPASVTIANARTLELATFHVRTEMGLAPTGYSHDLDFPIYGTGQGSANSPAIWCFLSSTLFDCYDEAAHSAKYCDPTDSIHVNLGMIGFVDDCNGQTNAFSSDGSSATMQALVRDTQHNAQLWTNLLHASGGALELGKCSCHILQWQFSVQGAPVLIPSFPADTTQVKVWDSTDQQEHTLPILSAYTAHKTLGHYKDPAGTQMEQFRQLQAKSNSITRFLWKCPLTRREAWTFYYACYLPSVTYPLACSSLTLSQLDKVQRKAMSILVSRCGFNRNTKKEMLYGPLSLGGANFRHLYVQQGINQTVMFITQWRKNSMSGNLLKIAVAWFQVQTGVSYSILDHVKASLPQLESKWLSSLRNFLAGVDARLAIDQPSLPRLQRLHDFNLMDVIQSSQKFTPTEICRLNYCRLFLKAVTVSDLTDISGKRLDPCKRRGDFSLLSSITSGVAIHQESPSDKEWTLWGKANALWSQKNGDLLQPLGD
jgi:hypothetical protein